MLTVGFPTCSDPGAWWTLNVFFHQFWSFNGEFLIVDNSPAGCPMAVELERHANQFPQVRYIRETGAHSSCLHKDRIFREARGDVVVCIDSHVILGKRTIAAITDYFSENPSSRDLLTGVLRRSTGAIMATEQMLYDDGGDIPSDCEVHSGVICRGGQLGAWRITDEVADRPERFHEVDSNGSWLLAMRREAWPGFHPDFKGFGGNEVYLYEKVRWNGGRVLVRADVCGVHNFSKSHRKGYPVDTVDRIRNYLVGFRELGNQKLEAATKGYFSKLWPTAYAKAIQEVGETPMRTSHRDFTHEDSPPIKGYDRLMDLWSKHGGTQSGAIPRELFDRLSSIPKLYPVPNASGVHPITRTLEIGSGLSTLLFGTLETHHVSIEHDREWANRLVRAMLMLDQKTVLRVCDLVGDWYGWEPTENDVFDYILIDGPPGNLAPGVVRHGILQHLPRLLSPHTVIFVDDTNREDGDALSKDICEYFNRVASRNACSDGRSFDVLFPKYADPSGTGPGTRLHKMFSALGVPACNSCLRLAHYMDEWGEDGCRRNLGFIIEDIVPRAMNWIRDASLMDRFAAVRLVPWNWKSVTVRGMVSAIVEKVLSDGGE